MRSAGVDVGELPPLPEFLASSEQIVHDYERDIGPLPSIPPTLLDDAVALGWRITDLRSAKVRPAVIANTSLTLTVPKPFQNRSKSVPGTARGPFRGLSRSVDMAYYLVLR